MTTTLIVIISISLGFLLGAVFTNAVNKNRYHIEITAEDTDFEDEPIDTSIEKTNFLTNIEVEDVIQFVNDNLTYQRKKVDFQNMKDNIISKILFLN